MSLFGQYLPILVEAADSAFSDPVRIIPQSRDGAEYSAGSDDPFRPACDVSGIITVTLSPVVGKGRGGAFDQARIQSDRIMLKIDAQSLPYSIKIGDRVEISSHPYAGDYRVESFAMISSGRVLCRITPI